MTDESVVPEAARPLVGRGAVITGGGRGIGSAVARALAGAGARVVVSARSRNEIEAVAAGLVEQGGEAWAIPCDVSDTAQIETLARKAAECLGRVDILVNNAGIAESAPLKAVRLEDWERIFAVNVTGTFLCTQAMLPGMLQAGWGRVVNVASIAGKMGAAYITAYSASKHAVIGFTRALAVEVATSGVTVNAVCPGYVDTPMTDQSVARIVEKTGLKDHQVRRNLKRQSPQNRMMEADEVAFQVLGLCDPRAKGINGQAIVVDGGAVQS